MDFVKISAAVFKNTPVYKSIKIAVCLYRATYITKLNCCLEKMGSLKKRSDFISFNYILSDFIDEFIVTKVYNIL